MQGNIFDFIKIKMASLGIINYDIESVAYEIGDGLKLSAQNQYLFLFDVRYGLESFKIIADNQVITSDQIIVNLEDSTATHRVTMGVPDENPTYIDYHSKHITLFSMFTGNIEIEFTGSNTNSLCFYKVTPIK